MSYNRKQFGVRRKTDYKPKGSAKAQRQRRASLAQFNERMQAKPANPGEKRVGFGADTDVAAVAFTTSPGAVRLAEHCSPTDMCLLRISMHAHAVDYM